MSARELEVAALFRADATLLSILTGKVWARSQLGTEGITSPTTTPAAYSAGKLLPCCVVKARGDVDDARIFDEAERVVAESVVIECWLYEYITSAAIEAAKTRIFTLLQGHRLAGAWPAERVFTLAVTPSPEMVGVQMTRVDYQIRSLRKAMA